MNRRRRIALKMLPGLLVLLGVPAWLTVAAVRQSRRDIALIAAIKQNKQGDVTAVRRLLAAGADPNARDNGGRIPSAWQPLHALLDRLRGRRISTDAALILAMDVNSTEIVRMLLAKGANANVRDRSGEPALHHSMESSDPRFILHVTPLLLDSGADVNARNKEGRTVLMRVIAEVDVPEDQKLTELLLKCGADVKAVTESGETALMAAAGNDAPQVVRMLLDRGADPNAAIKKDTDRYAAGDTPLLLAACGLKENVQMLLASGANANAKNSKGLTALSNAAQNNHSDIIALLRPHITPIGLSEAAILGDAARVRSLLAQGMDVNARDPCGNTPLHWAVDQGHADTVRALLAAGALPNIKNSNGSPPLFRAVENERIDLVKHLLASGAHATAKDNTGYTVLDYVSGNKRPDIIKLLVAKGVNVNARNANGETALNLALEADNPVAAKALLDAGATIPQQKILTILAPMLYYIRHMARGPHAHRVVRALRGRLPHSNLLTAALLGEETTVRSLLAAGADPNVATVEGCTPLQLAAQEGHAGIVRALLAHHADVDLSNSDGLTALIMAVCAKQTEIVRILLDHGADVHAVEGPQWSRSTALYWAVDSGQKKVVKLLLDKGADPNEEVGLLNTNDKLVDLAKEEGYNEIAQMLKQAGGKSAREH